MRSAKSIELRRAYLRDYFRELRQIIRPKHDFIKGSCCAQCRRIYNREKMREYRGKKRA